MSKECLELHNYIRKLKRYKFPLDKDIIPENGVYILFEKNELGHDGERIVRIGTHTGDNNLFKRLKEHFCIENKDRSIFRKNIGRAILNKRNDNYLPIWEIDFTPKKNKELFGNLINKQYQMEIEKEVTDYIVNNFSFSVIEILDKEERLNLERKFIEIVSSCTECKPSKNWLGNYSTENKIKEKGLWQVQHVK